MLTLACLAAALSFIKSDLQYASAFCEMSLAASGAAGGPLLYQTVSIHRFLFPRIVLPGMIAAVGVNMNGFRSLEYFCFRCSCFYLGIPLTTRPRIDLRYDMRGPNFYNCSIRVIVSHRRGGVRPESNIVLP